MRKPIGIIKWCIDNLDDVIVSTGLRGSELRATCPFCMSRNGFPDTNRHLYINKLESKVHCFRCDYVASWVRLVVDVEGCSETQAIITVARKQIPKSVQDIRDRLSDSQDVSAVDDKVDASGFPNEYQHLKLDGGKRHIRALSYLKRRNIPKYMALSGMFGIVPYNNRLYMLASDNYYQARSILKLDKPKYLNPASKKREVFGLWDSPYVSSWVQVLPDPIYVVEGIFSGISVVAAGNPAIALLGKKALDEQLNRLAYIKRFMVIMLDSDAIGNSWELAEQLVKLGKENIDVAVLAREDPAEGLEHELYSGNWLGKLRYRIN